MTTDELLTALHRRLAHGQRVDDLLAPLSQVLTGLHGRLSSPDAQERDRSRAEVAAWQRKIADLARLGEERLESLRTELAALNRKGSLDRLYGLTNH